MATLADAGRITEDNAVQEIERLQRTWTPPPRDADADIVSCTLGARVDDYDLFDRLQLQRVLEVCEASASLSQAGRTLFGVSRQARK